MWKGETDFGTQDLWLYSRFAFSWAEAQCVVGINRILKRGQIKGHCLRFTLGSPKQSKVGHRTPSVQYKI